MILVGTRDGVVEVCVAIDADYLQTLLDMYPDLTFTEQSEGAPMVPNAPVVGRVFTKMEWMDRFTQAELASIFNAAKVSVDVEVWLERFRQSSYVDPSDPRTVGGVQALEAVGILAAGRAAEILG